MRLLSASILAIAIPCSLATSIDSAIEQLQSLRATLHRSRVANDWQANFIAAKAQKTLLNENPTSLLEVARAEVHLGDLDAALHQLEQFVRMGQSTDLTAPALNFNDLYKKSKFANLQTEMQANLTPISLGSTAFQLRESGLLAEDVDFDLAGRRFLITSVRQHKIIALSANGGVNDFAISPDHWPMMAIKIDRHRNLVWATEVALQGFSFAPESDWGRSAILCYDLKTGRLLHRVEGKRGSALGDMALMKNGDVIVSDGDGGGIYRLFSKNLSLDRIDGRDFISPQTPTMHPDGKHIFIPDYERGIAILDPSTRYVHWLSTAGRFALNGIDGLYFRGNKLIAIQNGTSPERIVIFTLNPALTEIEHETVVERSTPTLGDPTHGVVVGKNFYYIANSGWDSIDAYGNMKPEAKPSPPRLMVISS